MYTESEVESERASGAARSIFRAHALRQHGNRAAEPVFPRSAAPRAFVSRWALFGALVCLACLALSSRVPVYVRGIAIITASATNEQGRPAIAILIPPQDSARLRIGQRVLVRLPSGPAETTRIAAIRPGIMTELQIRDLVDITASAALTLAGSKAVALAELDPASTIAPAPGNVPGCREALVEVGSRGVITLMSWGQSAQ